MMSKRKRFGVSEALTRGLSETINVVENNAGVFRNVILPLSRIELDPENPRKLAITLLDVQEGLNKSDPLYDRKLNELERLKELAQTIESSGVINPVVVYKRGEVYRVVAGERRCLASILANKQEIEARIFNEKPKGFELKLIQWIENTAREDLTLDERIGNIREIIHEYHNQHGEVSVSATLLKNITGLSLPQATYYLAVMQAPDDLQKMIADGQIRSLDKAAVIAGINSSELRNEVLQACINGSSLKELRNMVARDKQSIKKQSLEHLPLKRGRAVSRINMGFTLKTDVVQAIVNSVLNQEEFKRYSDIFSKVNWAHYEQASRAFRKLIEILEHQIVR
jgi:ParB family chromosome partitioning protein